MVSNKIKDSVLTGDQLPKDGPYVGVGLGRPRSDQNHTGIIYSEATQSHFLELRWHHELNQRTPPHYYSFVLLKIPKLRLPAVIGICRLVWETNREGKIPYGFRYPNDCFDSLTGQWLLGETGLGLTCATFIIATLKTAGINLLILESWPP